jgi:hypothetical protein
MRDSGSASLHRARGQSSGTTFGQAQRRMELPPRGRRRIQVTCYATCYARLTWIRPELRPCLIT